MKSLLMLQVVVVELLIYMIFQWALQHIQGTKAIQEQMFNLVV